MSKATSTTVSYKYGNFEINRIAKPEDLAGKMEPFKACWEVQSLLDGEQRFFDTKKECIEWIRGLMG
jgi:hypothetical protein